MKKIKRRIQCKCEVCGKVWMAQSQWSVCADCNLYNFSRAMREELEVNDEKTK